MNKGKLRKLIVAAILSALIIVMNFIPYTGYISYGVIEITTLHIVVILGAVLLGWVYGAVLGGVWGVTCLIRAYIYSVFLQFGFGNPLISVLPRILVGLVAGLVFAALCRTRLHKTVSLVIATICGTLTNTVLVLSGMNIFLKSTAYETLQQIMGTIISLNGSIELVAAIIIVPAIYFALQPRELVLGIDMGASATKLALVRGKTVMRTLLMNEDEALDTALERIGLNGVKRVALTGVGASFVEGSIAGLPTSRVDEFTSLSRGVSFVSRSYNCLAASVGTGTSFVRITPLRTWHVGGSGVGGALLLRLGQRLCGADAEALLELAKAGRLKNVDLELGDVFRGKLSNLVDDTTAANLAKLDDSTRPEDAALGIYNLVFQSIGVMAAFAVKTHFTRKIVVVGTVVEQRELPARILKSVGELNSVRFIIPENAGFVTAIGAARLS